MFGYVDGEGGPSGRKREQGDRAEREQSLWLLGSLPVSDLYGKRRNELGFFLFLPLHPLQNSQSKRVLRIL